MMKRIFIIVLGALLISVFGSTPVDADGTQVSQADVIVFQAAGDVGGGVLTPGDMFPPTSSGHAILRRKDDTINLEIRTSGLPPGAYTIWWVVWNNPDGCEGPCGEDDLFSETGENSVFWAGYDIVTGNGKGNFTASYTNGDPRGEDGEQNIIDLGFGVDPATAEVHNIIKYHGPASEDPDVLFDQLYTLLGSCDQGANALDLGFPFGVQCFDPQAVVHPLP